MKLGRRFLSISREQNLIIVDVICNVKELCLCVRAQSCSTLCYLLDCSPPASSVHGISQARILEWVAISSSRGIFATQGSNPRLLHWQAGSLPLSHQGIPKELYVDRKKKEQLLFSLGN